MKSSAVMTRDVVVVAPTVTVGGAAGMMQRLNVRHLPVVEAGRLVGILSDRDLLKHPPDASCGEAMTPAPVTCPPAAPVSQVAALMLEHKVDSIPIVGFSGTLVGLVTSSDLIGLLVERAAAEVLPFDFTIRVAASDGDPLTAVA
jgi:acetoin utilization protein AcuB